MIKGLLVLQVILHVLKFNMYCVEITLHEMNQEKNLIYILISFFKTLNIVYWKFFSFLSIFLTRA